MGQQELVDLTVSQQQMEFAAFGSRQLSLQDRASAEKLQLEEVD